MKSHTNAHIPVAEKNSPNYRMSEIILAFTKKTSHSSATGTSTVRSSNPTFGRCLREAAFSCYKSFDTEWDLLKHIPTHKKTKSLRVHICPFCGKSYSLVTYLIKHVEEKHAPAQSLRRVVRSKVQENEITSTMNSDNSTMDSMEDSIGSSLPTSPTLSSNSEDGSRSQRLGKPC